MVVNTKTCFVIAPIGADDSPQRKRSDDVLSFVITPAVEQRGYKVVRADKTSKPGMITTDIFQHLFKDELVIADLTDQNPNVFYELAVRHASQKPVIQLLMDGQSIPFDVAQSRTIFYKYQDIASMFHMQQEIVRQIDVLESDPKDFDNPLSMAVTLRAMRETDNPIATGIAEILSLLQDVRHEVVAVRQSSMSTSWTTQLQMPFAELDYIKSPDDPRRFLIDELYARHDESSREGARLDVLKERLDATPDAGESEKQNIERQIRMRESRMRYLSRRINDLTRLLASLGVTFDDDFHLDPYKRVSRPPLG